MSFGSGSLRLARLFTGLALLVGVPLVLYWTFFMSRRLDDWQRTNIALLGTMARTLETRLVQERDIATNEAKHATQYLASLQRGELIEPEAKPAAHRQDVKLEVQDGAASIEFKRDGGVWRSRFDELFDPVMLDTDFDSILVIDAGGRLIYRDERSPQLAVGSSVRLTRADGNPMGVAELTGNELSPQQTEAKSEAIPAAATSLRDRLLGIAEVPRVRLGEGEQLAYAHAVALPDVEEKIAVLGLVGTRRLVRHAVRLSPIALTWIFAVVMAMFLAIPYLKIRYLGRYEPLRAVDIWQLVLVALFGTGVATLLLLQIGTLGRFRAPVDVALQRFALDVSEQVHDEIAAAFAQLKASAPAISASAPGARGSILASRNSFEHYPYFEALLLTDDVRQTHKWMRVTVPTPMITVNDSPWFQRAWALPAGGAPFVFESIVAKNSAHDLAMIATPVRLARGSLALGPDVPFEERTGVAAVATQMLSLRKPVTPLGFEFVVIGPDDRVAFRSSGSRNARESFYEHIDEGSRLRALAKNSRGQRIETAPPPLDFRYRGRMHRGTVMPLPDASMTLVAYYDKALIEAPAGRVFAMGLAWLVMLTLVCFTAGALSRWTHPATTDWAWPTARFHSVYLLGCLIFVAIAALILALAWGRPRWWSGYALLGIPAATIAVLPLLPLHWVADRVRALEGRWRWMSSLRRVYPYSYVLAGVTALVALIGVPIAIVHLDAVKAHRAALLLAVQLDERDAVAARARQWNERLVVGQPICTRAEDAGCRVIAVKAADRERLLQPRFDVYRAALVPSPDADVPNLAALRAPTCDALFSVDRERLPHLYFSSALAPCLHWLGHTATVSDTTLAAADASTTLAESRSVDALSLASRSALPGLALLLALAFFVHSVSRRVLGLQLEGDGVVDRSSEIDVVQRGLLLRPPPWQVATLAGAIKAQSGESFDLADPTLSLDTVLAVAPDLPLLLTGVETRLHDAADRVKLLEILEKPRCDGRLLLVAAIEPLYYLGARAWESNAASVPPEMEAELRRWARALDGFERIRFDLASNVAVTPVVRVRKRLLVKLRRECAWHDRLQEIERGLILRGDLDRFDWERMVDYVLDAAEPRYQFLWSLCSMEERYVLRQLVAQGFVNPHFFDVLRRLRRRRLVRVDPRIRVASESFHRFIRDLRPSASELAWNERLPIAATSDRIRGPLLVIGGLAAAVLALTQAELLNSALAAATTVAGTLTAVATVAARVRQGGGGTNS